MIGCGYKCEGCKKPVDVAKSLSIFRFPKILVIHLKRFYHSYMRREKLNTTIKFPTTGLDLRKYAPNSSKFLIQVNSISDHSTKSRAIYNLFGVSHHSGSLYGGHYIGEVMSMSDRRWYNCNDSTVRPIAAPDNNSSSVYVLFYMIQE